MNWLDGVDVGQGWEMREICGKYSSWDSAPQKRPKIARWGWGLVFEEASPSCSSRFLPTIIKIN